MKQIKISVNLIETYFQTFLLVSFCVGFGFNVVDDNIHVEEVGKSDVENDVFKHLNLRFRHTLKTCLRKLHCFIDYSFDQGRL